MENALLDQTQQTLNLTQQAQVLYQNLTNAHTLITAAAEDNAAYHTILSDPPLLAQYTDEFFGPNGVMPLQMEPVAPAEPESARDRLAAEVSYGEGNGRMLPPRGGVREGQLQFSAAPPMQAPQAAPAQQQYAQAPAPQQVAPMYEPAPAPAQAYAQAADPNATPLAPYQRPQFDMAAPQAAAAAGDFWPTFFHMMDHNPQAAAAYYDANATAEAFRGRVFMSENG